MDDANVAQAGNNGYVNPLQMQSATDPYLTVMRPDPAKAPLWGVSGLQGDGTGGAQNYMEDPSAVLARVLQYDPNAHLTPFSYFGPDGAENRQQVTFDQSKLPQPKVPGTVFAGNTPLYNPRAVYQDPNYGEMTVDANVNRRQNDSTWLDVVGPIAVSLFTGGLGGFSMLGSLMTKLPNVASMLSGAMQSGGQQISPQQLALYRLLSQNRG